MPVAENVLPFSWFKRTYCDEKSFFSNITEIVGVKSVLRIVWKSVNQLVNLKFGTY